MVNPNIPNTTIRAMNMKNKTLAIDAAPSARPVKPKIAAMIAITKNMADHFSMIYSF
jgi:hypothetical protein